MPHYKDTENKLHWLDDAGHEYLLPTGSVQITDEEAESLRPQPPAPTYAELRAAEYPDYRDYLDGIVKGDQAQVQAYIDACLAVKAKYPKPADEVTE
jgi:hypothetical protein